MLWVWVKSQVCLCVAFLRLIAEDRWGHVIKEKFRTIVHMSEASIVF